ncbi:MAG: asparagine synthase-related protein, partial [Lentisphaeria bacterium]|nr:asparagine synthase-related protein [Lentisphaeria bacterium]
IDEGRIADFLVSELEGIDKTSTFSANIQRLPPACWLTVDRQGLRTRTWWEPEVTRPIRFRSDDQYVEAFLEHFSRAVRCRLRSATPPASMLSGGMDSSAVVAVARNLQNQSGGTRLHTFSAVMPDRSSCSETHFIHRVLGSGSQTAHLVAADRLAPFLGDLQQAVAAPDNLFDIFMTLPSALYRAARGEGCKSLLDGVAGDNLCSFGDGYLAHLLRQGRWLTVLADGFRKGTTAREYDSAWRLLHTNARAALATDGLRKLKQRFLPGDDGVREAMRESAIRPAFAARIGLRDRLRRLRGHHAGGLSQNPVQAHARKLLHPYLTVGLERYDRVAARCGIEPRCPYTDRRLVELYLALPLDQKDRRGWSKYLLRRSMTRHLPRDVCFRTDKNHLGWQFTSALMDRCKQHLDRTITRELSEVGDYVDEAKVRQANHRLQGGSASDTDRQFVWEAAALIAWKKANLGSRVENFGQKEIGV